MDLEEISEGAKYQVIGFWDDADHHQGRSPSASRWRHLQPLADGCGETAVKPVPKNQRGDSQHSAAPDPVTA